MRHLAVAYSESTYKVDAYNRNTNGSNDRGLWQINSIHNFGCDYYDPTCNARAMASLSQGGSYWRPWRGYGTQLFWQAYNGSAKSGADAVCDPGPPRYPVNSPG